MRQQNLKTSTHANTHTNTYTLMLTLQVLFDLPALVAAVPRPADLCELLFALRDGSVVAPGGVYANIAKLAAESQSDDERGSSSEDGSSSSGDESGFEGGRAGAPAAAEAGRDAPGIDHKVGTALVAPQGISTWILALQYAHLLISWVFVMPGSQTVPLCILRCYVKALTLRLELWARPADTS